MNGLDTPRIAEGPSSIVEADQLGQQSRQVDAKCTDS